MESVQAFSIHSPQLSTTEDAVGFVVKTNAGEQMGSISRSALLALSPGQKGSLLDLFELNYGRILKAGFLKWSVNPSAVLVLGTADFE
ncbi:hypothetical protein [Cupriavidus sp.]|uniref:hypothetical protein n=1 Tax=Cupriavidus sp. TaxID=1873897 RepID=UPI0025BCDB5E|nr:hypothetical protein [Cupriavidus sp.]MCA3187571.1 hypothetical protein [Cupriavidus sp.]MCA3190957.1 hypothetical protein [Cupriavidus sp.]MCA3199301.1 hypothetical protein [Cupriavidus sp.]MCA3204568.1 hypothetical protein [Cupriavidus sp.]MCA3207733.1 hypothetical protein [Cupriavidus sp.]